MQEKLFGQSASLNVLVYGWYNHNNIGDDLFVESFKELFPNINFSFSDNITVEKIKDASAVFIGGGSFLSEEPAIEKECLKLIRTKPILYIGIGTETGIHPIHQDLMRVAKLIAIRSSAGLEKVKELNKNVTVIPDIVYCLSNKKSNNRIGKSVLILPNIHVIPSNTDAHWMYNAWENFKFEFSQFLDYLIKEQYLVNFLSMCNNKKENDTWAAIEIINSMKNRDQDYIVKSDLENIKNIFSKYEYVITQRFHGMILSEVTRTPYISIYHHDKLKSTFLNEGNFISYYSFSKQTLIDQFYLIKEKKLEDNMAIESDIFERLKDKVNSILFASEYEICWGKE